MALKHFELLLFLFVVKVLIFDFPVLVQCTTDANDVQALQAMYSSLNSPSQLTSWKSIDGDPCGESWKGITCEGSAVVSVQISGLGLDGTMGYMLSNLMSLRTFDLSDNNIHDPLPYQLPPNLTSLNLAKNNLSGNLPYSISTMVSLSYLNVSRNSLSQSIGDVFHNLSLLSTMDVSFNNFSGDIPSSFSSLSNLSTLNVQNNQLTGSLNVLTAGAEMQEPRVKNMAAVTDLKPPPAEKLVVERLLGNSGSIKRMKSPITATSYSVASLQTATNSFSQEFIIGEGSLGRVYRGDFPHGKIMAIKKIDNAALSLQEEDNFLEAVSNMSHLRHPNIVSLAGYCVEHGQRLLVYEFIANGSLHDILHFADDGSKTLSWNARVRVALGTARALDSRVRSEQSLVRWATPQLHDIDALAKMVDPALNGMYPAKSLSRFADIIALCVQPEPEFRPPMSEVVQALVRLVQRASVVKRRPSDDSGFAYKTPDHEAIDSSL
ncbi:STRUBBELIG-RECEPTOR FAMILY 8-like [Populus alba x Populus x berolinensis]|nr:STRUBBELIG-RECEPTOR FAMILY 8-like [Populus alba x Populus x berolinensis]